MASSSFRPPWMSHLLLLSLLMSTQLFSSSVNSSTTSSRPRIIKFYLQQENEFATFPAGSNIFNDRDREQPTSRSGSNASISSSSNNNSTSSGGVLGSGSSSNTSEGVHDRVVQLATAATPGSSIAYEYAMTREASPSSEVMGFVRGTAVAVGGNNNNNLAVNGTLFFVSNVIHFSSGEWAGSTISQQGEAVFSARAPWELAIVGGTADFRHASGYNVGRLVSTSRTSRNTTRLTTRYHAHLSYPKPN